ncbi:MAG: ABC transporter ATP-binding protein [Candidatus Amulumruptor caecigallinarius]|nr:ABC transporter ATP-binding protein [Candidatus Amulumruptor caecigallinarius]MCM1396902.1 ABC transporter ATP-binding protein [Candidatus Amulumruptor caecigallinarius]MCM1454154.1 ABC transporter ATP-binding protein [bacterium]
MISTSRLSVGYRSSRRTRLLLSDVNISLAPGLTALLGGNGRGKSTLMRTLAGLQSPLAGSVTVDGVPLSDLSPAELARRLTIVTGSSAGAGAFTVEELVAMGRYPYTGFFGRKSPRDRKAIARAMELTGITSLRTRHVGSLSDGERQKALIAKALAQDTPTILLDEPTAYLDVAARLELLALLAQIAHADNRDILLSTHDIAPTLPIADTLWLMLPNSPESSDTSTPPETPESTLITGTPATLTADGSLDRLFPKTPIHFDPRRGDFILTTPHC